MNRSDALERDTIFYVEYGTPHEDSWSVVGNITGFYYSFHSTELDAENTAFNMNIRALF